MEDQVVGTNLQEVEIIERLVAVVGAGEEYEDRTYQDGNGK